jgi:hypothetical protein
MPKSEKCSINAQEALRLRDFLKRERQQPPRFLCNECERPVRVEAKSSAGAAHFEHKTRNLNCSLSDKRTFRKLYANHPRAK